jgi:hypothetical protein
MQSKNKPEFHQQATDSLQEEGGLQFSVWMGSQTSVSERKATMRSRGEKDAKCRYRNNSNQMITEEDSTARVQAAPRSIPLNILGRWKPCSLLADMLAKDTHRSSHRNPSSAILNQFRLSSAHSFLSSNQSLGLRNIFSWGFPTTPRLCVCCSMYDPAGSFRFHHPKISLPAAKYKL